MTSRRGFLRTAAAAAVSATPGSTLRAASNGYVRVEQINGVWWFVGPDGKKFVSMGVNHIEPHLWLAPYNKAATLERYGADLVGADGYFDTKSAAAQRWIDRQVEICKDLHFNTFAKHTHPSIDLKLYQDKVYYVASLETAPLAGWRERNGEGPRPDVFSAEFERFVEDRVRQVCLQHKESRNLLGYLYTDIPSWLLGQGEKQTYPWVDAIVGLGEHTAGKQRWLGHLRGRYGSAEECAKVWGLPISPTYGITWERMGRLTEWSKPVDASKARLDMFEFLPVLADKWYGLHRELVLRHDPNHLILGDKNLIQNYYPFLIPALKKYVDVVAIQAYGRWSNDGPLTESIYKQTGKPIFNGDGSYSFVNSHQQEWGAKGFRAGAKSLEEVASFYHETLKGMMAKPYIIGWHHCGYLEQWDEAERGDSPRNENGFMDPFERYHTVWTDVIRESNSMAEQWHAK